MNEIIKLQSLSREEKIFLNEVVNTVDVLQTLSWCEELLCVEINEKWTILPLYLLIKIVWKWNILLEQNKIKKAIKQEEIQSIDDKLKIISTARECENFFYGKLDYLAHRWAYDLLQKIIDKRMELQKLEILPILKQTIENWSNGLEDLLQNIQKIIKENLLQNMTSQDAKWLADLIWLQGLVEFSNEDEFLKFFETHTSDFADYIDDVFDEQNSPFEYKVIIQIIKFISQKFDLDNLTKKSKLVWVLR